jgi:hypothetical protein
MGSMNLDGMTGGANREVTASIPRCTAEISVSPMADQSCHSIVIP